MTEKEGIRWIAVVGRPWTLKEIRQLHVMSRNGWMRGTMAALLNRTPREIAAVLGDERRC